MLSEVKKAIDSGQLDLALQLCTILLKNGEDPMLYVYRGAALATKGDLTGAEEAFLRAKTLDKTLIAPYKNLAQIHLIKNDPRAIDELILASWLDPDDPKPSADLARINPEICALPDVDLVFYTGTPWLDHTFSPQDYLKRPLGGSESSLLCLVRELAKIGYRIAVFCNTNDIQVYDNVFFYPVAQYFIRTRAREVPVLVAFRFVYPLTKKIPARRRIVWLQDTQGSAMRENLAGIVGETDLIFSLSEFHGRELMARHNIPAKKLVKTRNGFDAHFFEGVKSARLPGSLVYFSRPERGLGEALEAFKLVRMSLPHAVLHVCAYTPFNDIDKDESLKSFVPLLRQNGVIYHGGLAKPELVKLLSQTELMLYPNVTDLETSCVAAIEAMAAGVAVVTSDRGALPETVADGVGGVVIAYGRGDQVFVKNLAQAAVNLLGDKKRLASLSDSAQTRAWQIFSWQKIASEWDGLLKQII